MPARICAVLSAAFLVAAVAITALLPMGYTLGRGLAQANEFALAWLQRHSLPWAWQWIALPFLERPLWLLPAGIGLIFAGLALTFNLGKPSTSRRRRS